MESISYSSEKSVMDIAFIHEYLSKQSYWAKERSIEEVKASIKHSHVFGMFCNKNQIGFARVITDYVTHAYLADVFVSPAYQKKGYGRAFIQHIVNAAELQGVKRWMLATNDAKSLYSKFGFQELSNPGKYMELKK